VDAVLAGNWPKRVIHESFVPTVERATVCSAAGTP
jgi:hypothetical protein